MTEEVGDVTVVCFKPLNSCSSSAIQRFGSLSANHTELLQSTSTSSKYSNTLTEDSSLFKQTTNKNIGMQLIR